MGLCVALEVLEVDNGKKVITNVEKGSDDDGGHTQLSQI